MSINFELLQCGRLRLCFHALGIVASSEDRAEESGVGALCVRHEPPVVEFHVVVPCSTQISRWGRVRAERGPDGFGNTRALRGCVAPRSPAAASAVRRSAPHLRRLWENDKASSTATSGKTAAPAHAACGFAAAHVRGAHCRLSAAADASLSQPASQPPACG